MSQTSKTLAGLVVLLLLAGGVGLYAWKGVYESDKHTERKKAHEEKLFSPQKLDEKQGDGGSAVAEFTSLRIAYLGATTALEKRDGTWWLTSPVRAKADRMVLDGVLSQLQTARFKASLDEHPDAETLKRYGLDQPTFTVEAAAEVGDAREARTVKLEGGIENTFDGSIFMRRNGGEQVFTAEGGVRYALAKTTFDLREKQVMAVDEAALQSLTVKSQANDWAAERGADGLWRFTRPFAESMDPTQFSAMIAAHSAVRAQAFPEGVEANFEAPVLSATLTLKTGALVKVRFAKVVADGGERLLGLREDAEGKTVAEFATTLVELNRNPMDLKDKAVVRFKKELVTKIVLHSDTGEVVLARDSGGSAEAWRVVAPREGKAKVFKVTSVLWTLGSFKAAEWLDEKPKDWGKFGVDAKARFIALSGADGAELARFTIGKEVPGKAGTFYVRGTRDQVATSEGGRFGEFPWGVTDVLDEADAGVK